MAERGGGKGRGRPRKRGREESSTEEISDHSTNLESRIGMKTIPSLVIGYTDKLGKLRCKRGKGRNVAAIPHSSYEWETVATNFDEFVNVSKLFLSTNRTEVAVGKKLKNNMLPEIEKVHKRKEKLLKKQNRQALMLDNMMNMDGLVAGRSLRDRKPVTYTFDD
ncbi:DDT domain-containing protein ddr4 [Castilleja foliolosa]|uniref:DDT domain-containing protein ddr4 n=1 Tax=Castilleja foliolosa TaxID=1961234 RepID=A0ABD3DK15_9LAMI